VTVRFRRNVEVLKGCSTAAAGVRLVGGNSGGRGHG
jgi:hypothetical protein